MDLKQLYEKIKYKANVIGYSGKLQPRIRKGQLVPEEKCFRVYVSKKVPLNQLKIEDIIPQSIDGIPTDVVEVGLLRSLGNLQKCRFRFICPLAWLKVCKYGSL
jgi:hypothetical protein